MEIVTVILICTFMSACFLFAALPQSPLNAEISVLKKEHKRRKKLQDLGLSDLDSDISRLFLQVDESRCTVHRLLDRIIALENKGKNNVINKK